MPTVTNFTLVDGEPAPVTPSYNGQKIPFGPEGSQDLDEATALFLTRKYDGKKSPIKLVLTDVASPADYTNCYKFVSCEKEGKPYGS